MSKIFKYEYPGLSKLADTIKLFGDYLSGLTIKYNPTYIVPLETKGAVILRLAFESVRDAISCPLIYRRAFDFLSKDELADAKCLIVDDTFFTGHTLGKVYKNLENKVKDVKLCALFDFSDIYEERDVNQEIRKKLAVPDFKELSSIAYIDVLRYIQNKIFSEDMPATYDHLMLKTIIEFDEYEALLKKISKTNRLLHYGIRGAFDTSAILLEDLIDGTWATPPKIRLWYNETTNLLRIAPIAFPSKDYEPNQTHISEKLSKIIVSKVPSAIMFDAIDVMSYTQRLFLMQYLGQIFNEQNIELKVDDEHLLRYYPGPVGQNLLQFLEQELSEAQPLPLKTLEDDGKEIIEYFSIVPHILNLLRNAYENQFKERMARKDGENKGYTVSEIIEQFKSNYSSKQIHAAIDYCYDYMLATSFYRNGKDSRPERTMRTTENGAHDKFSIVDLFGAAILYSSEAKKCSVWLPNKVYSIIERGLNTKLPCLIAVTGYHGDYNSLQVSENAYKLWSNYVSPLWDISAGKEDEIKKELLRHENNKGEVEELVTTDKRVNQYLAQIDAIHHLCKECGYHSAVLMNILCDQYGGTTYLAYNLENLLEEGIGAFCKGHVEAQEKFEKHEKGLEDKLKALENAEYIEKPRRRATQLKYHTRTIANQFLEKVSPLPRPNSIYETASKLFEKIKDIYKLVEQKNYMEVSKIYKEFGATIEEDISNQNVIQNLRSGQNQINKYIYAISGKHRDDVSSEVIKCRSSQEIWLLAYDLRKSRGDVARKLNQKKGKINIAWHGLIENWIIANRGKLSKALDNKGDLRYGFFSTEDDALNATFWIDYHSRLLNNVHPFFTVPVAFAGIGLAKGIIEPDGRGGVQGDELDTLGHQLKEDKDYNELVELLADQISGKDGRAPIWVLKPEKSFPSASARSLIGQREQLKGIEIAPLNNPLTDHSLPWSSYVNGLSKPHLPNQFILK